MTKALFAIKEVESGRLLQAPMFTDKQLAKGHRKELNPRGKDGDEIFKYVVTFGPDHDKYEPEGVKFLKVKSKHETETEKEHVAVA